MRSFALVVLLLICIRAAEACSCMANGSPDDPESPISKNSDIIFVGEITGIDVRSYGPRKRVQTIRFKPLVMHKGNLLEFVEIVVHSDSRSTCDGWIGNIGIGDRMMMSGSLAGGQVANGATLRYYNGFCSLRQPVDHDTLKPLKPVR